MKTTALTSSSTFDNSDELVGNVSGTTSRMRAAILSRLPAWDSTWSYQSGDFAYGGDGNVYVSLSSNSNKNPLSDTGNNWQLATVLNAVTLNIPSRFTTFAEAWGFLANAEIFGAAAIQFANGTHDMGASVFVLNHPHGHRISILGNVTTPASCVLDFSGLPAQTDGAFYEEDWGAFSVNSGNTLGKIDGFTMTGPGIANYGVAGLLAFNGASIICGEHMVINDFYAGIAAINRSYIQADGITITGGGDGNIFVYMGSCVSAQGCTSTGASTWYGKSGAMVEHGSSLFAPNSTFKNNEGSQVAVHFGSTAMLNGSSFIAEGGLIGTAGGIEMLFSDNCDLTGCTFTGVPSPRARILSLDAASGHRFHFGSTTYASTDFFRVTGQNGETVSFVICQENVASGFIGFVASSSTLVIGNDGAAITCKVGSSSSLNGTVVANFDAKGFYPVKLTSDPSSPVEGQLYYNTTSHKYKFYNGTTWETVTSA